MSSRRTFLTWTTAVPFLSRLPRPSLAARRFDPSFGTASEAARAIREGVISSRELLEHTLGRIRKHNPGINAFVTMNEEEAARRAREADESLARGKDLGWLHGLPILIKDTFETAGLRTTAGAKPLENHIPKDDAASVARLRAAGALIVGKTNTPEFAGDTQTFNAIAGTTNNPWNVKRTPGGSTGGGAAALAAGFGFLELGSDIGGSIRTPAHFCGVYGHKSSLGIVPLEGHIPPSPGEPALPPDLGVAGPLARSAQDLRLELETIAGPSMPDSTAFRWKLPPPRGAQLRDYRIGFVLDDQFCPVTPEVREPLGKAVEALRKAGVDLEDGWPAGVNPGEMFGNYLVLLSASFAAHSAEEELDTLRRLPPGPWGEYGKAWITGKTMGHGRWLEESAKRLRARMLWQKYFETHDAFLMPDMFLPAFPHDQEKTFFERSFDTSLGRRPYGDLLRWICFANLTGSPATVAPVGRTKDGLPVGIQILGPYLEDATPIDIAGRMADVVGGFEPPPGF